MKVYKRIEYPEELFKELFYYKDGVLFWKNNRGAKNVSGKMAGTINLNGYFSTHINHRRYLNHRIIFSIHYGYVPDVVDHINGIKTDNRIENLRPASYSDNNCNSKIRKDNKSGIKGVQFMKKEKLWRALIRYNGDIKFRKFFIDKNEAEVEIAKAREEIHREFCKIK